MATTKRGVYYPNDPAKIADVLTDMKKMAESIDEVIEDNEFDPTEIEQDIANLQISQATQDLAIENLQEVFLNAQTDEAQSLEVEDATGLGKLDVLGNYIQNGTPSTQNPVEIKTLGGNARNIFSLDNKIEGVKINRYDNIIEEDEKYSTFYQEVKPGEKYVFSFKSIGTYGQSANITYAQCNEVPEIGTEVYLSNMEIMDNLNGHVFEPSKKYLLFTILDVTLEEGIASIQLEKGETPTNYIPFKQGSTTIKIEGDTQSKNYTLLIQKEMLKGDYFSKEVDGWEEIHNWEKIDSYNDESVTTDFISTTGALTTGATVYYKLTETVKIKCTPEQSKILNLLDALELYEGKNKIRTIENIALLKLKYASNYDRVGVLEEKVEQLEQEVESYKNSLPRETLSGEYITMQNTADKVRFKDFILGGNSKQENSEVGNNILCINEFTNENGGLEQSYSVADDILSLNGSRSNNVSTVCEVKLYFKESGNYKIIKEDVSGDFSNGSIGIRAYNASEERLFFVQISNTGSLETSGEITEEMIGQINRAEIYTTTGAIFNNYKCKIMLAKENVAKYEKFIPNRPSPEFPAKIENVEGDVEVTVANKNIANANWAERFVNIVNNTDQAKLENIDGRRCLFWTANAGYKNDSAYFFKYMFKKNTRYVITFDIKPSTQNGNFVINYLDGTAGNRQNLTANTWQKITIISKANTTIKEIRPGYYSGQCYIDLDSVQIVEGTEEQDYVENEQQTVAFPLEQGQKLHLGDYLASDGIHHVRKQINLSDADSWNFNATYACVTLNMVSKNIQVGATGDIICNRLKSVSNRETEGITYNSSTSIYIKIDGLTSLEEYKEKFAEWANSEEGFYIEGKVITEEIEPYTTEQQEAYNKLKELTTYATQTNVYSTNNPSPVFTVTGIKDVNSLITQVNQLILEEGGN